MIVFGVTERGVVHELAALLYTLDQRERTTAEMTAYITATIVRWAMFAGWVCRTEARVRFGHDGRGRARIGYVDILVSRTNSADLAIEIDSTQKPWSMEKLRHLADSGLSSIWVRWGDAVWAGADNAVHVIQLSIPRSRRSRRRAADQLALPL